MPMKQFFHLHEIEKSYQCPNTGQNNENEEHEYANFLSSNVTIRYGKNSICLLHVLQTGIG